MKQCAERLKGLQDARGQRPLFSLPYSLCLGAGQDGCTPAWLGYQEPQMSIYPSSQVRHGLLLLNCQDCVHRLGAPLGSLTNLQLACGSGDRVLPLLEELTTTQLAPC